MNAIVAGEPGFIFEKMTTASRSDALEVIQEVFSRREPLSVWTGLGRKDWEFIVETSYYRALMKGGISVIARDAKTNKVVAASLAVDMYYHLVDDFWGAIEFFFMGLLDRYPLVSRIADLVYPNSLKLATYAMIGEELMSMWLTRHCPAKSYPHTKGLVLKDMGVGVLPEYQGRGLAQAMTLMRVRLAAEQGFHCIVVNCSNGISQHVYAKSGFKFREKINYDEFMFGGRLPFVGMRNLYNGQREYSLNLYDFYLQMPRINSH